MLNSFTNQKVRSRMQSGPIGPYLSEIATVLWQQGYARGTIRLHLRAVDQFGAWLLKEGLLPNDINNSVVDRYLEGLDRQFSPSCPGGRVPHKATKSQKQFFELSASQVAFRLSLGKPIADDRSPESACDQRHHARSHNCRNVHSDLLNQTPRNSHSERRTNFDVLRCRRSRLVGSADMLSLAKARSSSS
jgi:hypothetical protein